MLAERFLSHPNGFLRSTYKVKAVLHIRGQDDVTDRVEALLGRWEGHAVTRRTGMYGATIAEGDVTVSYDKMEDGRVTQVHSVHLTPSLLGVTKNEPSRT